MMLYNIFLTAPGAFVAIGFEPRIQPDRLSMIAEVQPIAFPHASAWGMRCALISPIRPAATSP